jgi:predicted nucleic acid-binding protein
MILLDTDVLIDIIRSHPSAVSWLDSTPDTPRIPGLSAMELAFGSQNTTELRNVQKFLSRLKVVWPAETHLQRGLDELPPLRLSHRLGVLDALIAATALGLELPLATFNSRHFSSVPGLTIVKPYER